MQTENTEIQQALAGTEPFLPEQIQLLETHYNILLTNEGTLSAFFDSLTPERKIQACNILGSRAARNQIALNQKQAELERATAEFRTREIELLKKAEDCSIEEQTNYEKEQMRQMIEKTVMGSLLKESMNGIPTLTNSRDATEINTFFFKIEECATLMQRGSNHSDIQKLIVSKLDPNVSRWYQGKLQIHPLEVNTPSEFHKCFMRELYPHNDEIFAHEDLKTMTQGTLSVNDFYNNFVKIQLRTRGISTNTLAELFMNGLNSTLCQSVAMALVNRGGNARKHATMADIYKLATEIEPIVTKSKKANTINVDRINLRNLSIEQFERFKRNECFICGSNEHSATEGHVGSEELTALETRDPAFEPLGAKPKPKKTVEVGLEKYKKQKKELRVFQARIKELENERDGYSSTNKESTHLPKVEERQLVNLINKRFTRYSSIRKIRATGVFAALTRSYNDQQPTFIHGFALQNL